MALYLIKDLDDDYHSRVGVWQITESEEELRELASVPSDEMEEISYIRNESLRKRIRSGSIASVSVTRIASTALRKNADTVLIMPSRCFPGSIHRRCKSRHGTGISRRMQKNFSGSQLRTVTIDIIPAISR